MGRRAEFAVGLTHETPEYAPPASEVSTFSEGFAKENGFQSQGDMRGEDW